MVEKSMERSLILAGSSRSFTEVFKRTLEDCGFKAEVRSGAEAGREEARDVFVYEITKESDLTGLPEGTEPSPYLVFTDAVTALRAASLKRSGLVGVITEKTTPEEITSLVNAVFFYTRILKRNPRVPVSIPVEIKAGSRLIKTTASTLSRDGLFAVTLNPLPADTVCDLSFASPLSGKQLSTKARVIYNISINKDLSIIASPEDPFKRLVTHPGMALLFLDLPEEDRVLLESYIGTVS